MLPIKSVLGQFQILPCAGLNVAINGVSKYYKLGVSDRIGSKMVILGCDIGVKDHRHFYDITCDFKHKLSSVQLNEITSKLIKQIGSNKNHMMEPFQPSFLCFLTILSLLLRLIIPAVQSLVLKLSNCLHLQALDIFLPKLPLHQKALQHSVPARLQVQVTILP